MFWAIIVASSVASIVAISVAKCVAIIVAIICKVQSACFESCFAASKAAASSDLVGGISQPCFVAASEALECDANGVNEVDDGWCQ